MILFERGRQPGKVYLSKQEDSAVQLAAYNLIGDIEKVCHVRPEMTHTMAEDVAVVVGTHGVTDMVNDLCWSELMDESGAPRWEGYLQQMKQDVLYLAGCDRRGTIYAIYTFCERIGVSPWYDLADVPVKEKNVIEISEHHFLVDWPSVQYRGIFLNDEEELDAWVKEHTDDGTIGPETYARIFELLLRLKGNYIWPAMHVNAFNNNPENGRLAHRMGIVTGTSHCDMLHRSNQNEWKRWIAAKGYEGLKYDYTIPGQNRERLMEYWRESLEQNRDFECCYTIGMRGIHDSGFVTSELSEDASPEEIMASKRALLEEIMDAQRALIREVIPQETVPQSFVPYKEVLPIYDSGLHVPDDVALIWVDDNHGYMRRYPSDAERQRSGGHGLYYHSSYWAPPGMSYLFICSIPLAQMGNELKKCYEQGIQRIWVDNVGALKPLEQDTEYFLRYAWDAGRNDSIVHDPQAFTQAWIDQNFSGGHGKEVAEIYTAFAQLNNLCKPEHMRSNVFSQCAYGDEAAARLWQLYALMKRGEQVYHALPQAEKDAFYQLMLMKMQAAFYISASYYFADRSLGAYEMGAMRAADVYTTKSREMDDLKRMMLYYYNHVMSHGKWHGILTPEEFPPPTLELYPRCRPALKLEEGRLLVSAADWGEADRLTFDACGRSTKWITLANTGIGELAYEIDAPADLHLSSRCGSVTVEQRIMVTPNPSFTQSIIRIRSGGTVQAVEVVREGIITAHEGCYIESDGYIHVAADHCATQKGFCAIPGMGRGVGAAMEANAETSSDRPAFMSFDMVLREDSQPTIEIIRFLTLNSTGHIRLRISVGAWQRVIVSDTTDEWLGSWIEAATRDGEKLMMVLPPLRAGKHTLRIEALDPYITLCAINIYTKPIQPCVLGPGVLDTCVAIPAFSVDELRSFFGLLFSEVPPPYDVIAGEEFWKQDMLYSRNYMQRGLWQHNSSPVADMRKDLLAGFRYDMVREQNGCLAWKAENALANSDNAWMTPDTNGVSWIHRQAETDGRQGLAMCLPAEGKDIWEDAEQAPSLYYRFTCEQDAVYHVWLLMKYDDVCGFNCRFLLDGEDLSEKAVVCRNHFHTYRTIYMWCWQKLISVHLTPGEHVLTIAAITSGMAIDQFYMTTANELPQLFKVIHEYSD